jgi:hypothetical protein
MLKLLDRILQHFRICFKREETFGRFVIIVVGMLLRTEMRGITTIIGCLCLEPKYYETKLHFFRSKAYDLVRSNAVLRLLLCYVSLGNKVSQCVMSMKGAPLER